ncbi:MAG: formate C-acetyltransferase [Stygiobacter sp.]|nr:MAG: formate C-acetyltransferase [Stygiobacter sp.]KAF0216798.1 MAG: formate [Ignavibacteria bacterium]
MTERINKLRRQSLDAIPTMSYERAQLLTEFYKSGEPQKHSVPVSRAMAFKYILEHKALCVNDGELFVGEKGPEPKATPTYPELCIHSKDDLEILHNREKVWFKSSDETRNIILNEVAPFWNGKSIREKILAEVDEEWRDAYKAGIFTEFMEQRAPGHTVGDDKIFRKGMLDFKKEIEEELGKLDFYNDKEAFAKREELRAMNIAADAIMFFAKRYSEKLFNLAAKEKDTQRKNELETMAGICERVPANAPRTMWEALQYYWFIHLGITTELNTWDSFNPGRLDQHLQPFYKRDLESGLVTEEFAKELLHSFWIKFNNQPAPPKVGVTAQESNTYTDFCLINVGGVTEKGEDATNEMTYILLDVIEEMRLLQPSSMVQVSKKNPDRLLKRALKIIRTGYGQPSIFNTDAIIQELTRQGKSIIDARCGGASGCVEAGAFGKESYILTGYFNIPKVFEITLNNGFDPRTQKQIGLRTGDPTTFKTYDEFYSAFEKQLNHFVDIKIKGNIIIERIYAQYMPAPFMSILIDDCIKKGKDYNAGGARYNSSYIQGVGLGTITDSLSSIKYNVFEKKNLTMSEMLELLKSNFENKKELRDRLFFETPRYGNDDDAADDITRQVFESYFAAVDGRPNTKGGHFRVDLLPTTCHVYFGSVLGATPDGRYAKEPVSEGISPVQGADVHGPTSVIKSASKIDHLRTGGTLLNQKFTPNFLATDDGIEKVVNLIRTYFRLDGHHIQFNVVNAELLKEAQKHPEKYRDLIVRVAGYSDYFVDLGIDLQNEIINRTEHMSF